MYRGFSLKINEYSVDSLINICHQNISGISFENCSRNQIIWNALNENIVSNTSIDADKLKSDWFPMIKSDIFLSHSHKDIKVAKKLSTLFRKLQLDTFIDSEVWRYSDTLVKEIEKRYYPYGAFHVHDKIVAHVNIMLISALTKMLNATECIIFLNTTHSIIPAGYSNADKTDSPWIYHELFTASILPINLPVRKAQNLIFNDAQQLKILHTPPTNHLTDLNDSDVRTWVYRYFAENYHALDVLYDLKHIN